MMFESDQFGLGLLEQEICRWSREGLGCSTRCQPIQRPRSDGILNMVPLTLKSISERSESFK